MSDEHILYDPTAEPRILASGLAPRLASLEGKRAGILDNSKANAGTLMLAVIARLKEKYGVRTSSSARRASRARRAPISWPRSRRATSSWSAAPTEGRARRGVSTAQSCWSSGASPPWSWGRIEFEQLAKLEAKNRGIADLPLALIPHPLGGIREDEVVKKADLAVEVVLKAVTRA